MKRRKNFLFLIYVALMVVLMLPTKGQAAPLIMNVQVGDDFSIAFIINSTEPSPQILFSYDWTHNITNPNLATFEGPELATTIGFDTIPQTFVVTPTSSVNPTSIQVGATNNTNGGECSPTAPDIGSDVSGKRLHILHFTATAVGTYTISGGATAYSCVGGVATPMTMAPANDVIVNITAPVAVTSVPTMNEWGMIIFMLLSGLGSIYFIRKQKRSF